MRFGYPKNPFLDFYATCGSIAKLLPVFKATTSNYVVDCCKCPLRVIQMTVQHTFRL